MRLTGLTAEDKEWLPLVEEHIDLNWYTCKENPGAIVVGLEAMGAPPLLVEYAKSLMHYTPGPAPELEIERYESGGYT